MGRGDTGTKGLRLAHNSALQLLTILKIVSVDMYMMTSSLYLVSMYDLCLRRAVDSLA